MPADAPDVPEPGPTPAAALTPLAPSVRTLWRLGAAIWWLVLTAAAAATLIASELPPGWASAVAAAGLLWIFVVPGHRYRHFGYRVSPTELRVAHGWLWRTTSVLLHSRVQHVDTRQGPIERMLGLSSVVVYTAGTVGAVTPIPGLARADAEALRERLLALSGADDAV
jgi:uncharacterized protein